MGRILFVDDYDSDRGPMAEAMANAMGLDAESVGTMPAGDVTLAAEKAMAQIGLHVRGHRPHWIDLHHLYGGFDRVIALGPEVARTCPDLHVQESWNIPHPGAHSLEENVHVRDLLARRVSDLAKEQRAWT